MNDISHRMALEQTNASKGIQDRLVALARKWQALARVPLGENDEMFMAGRETAFEQCADELMKVAHEL